MIHHIKHIILTCLLVFVAFHSMAQSPGEEIRIIKAGLDTLPAKEKAIAFTKLSSQYLLMEEGQDSAFLFANEALRLSQSQDYPEGIQKAYYYLGLHAWQKQEDYEAALTYFKEAKKSILTHNTLSNLPTMENAIGAIFLLTGEYEKALLSFQSAVDEAIEYNDYSSLAISSINQAIIYNRLKDTLKAIETNLKALDYLKKDTTKDQTVNTIITSLNLADIYRRKKDFIMAEKTLDRIKPVIDSLDYFVASARYVSARCQLLFDQGREEELYRLVDKKLPEFKDYQGYDKLMYSTLLYYQGRNQVNMNNPEEVKKIIAQFILFSQNTGIDHKNNLYQYIYDLASDINDYKTAFIYLDKYKVLKDSLLNENTKEKIIRLEKLYELEKKERLIQEGVAENAQLKRRNIMLVSVILGLMLAGMISYIYISRKRYKQKEKIDQIEQKMLSLQMNPHFIFNSISSIQNFLFDDGDTDKAINHLSVFATLMRQILEHSRKRLISLEDEVEFIENYLNLQKLRFNNKFNYQLNIDKNIDPSTLAIPPLLTQPFIENAIEHGKVYQVNGGLITIEIKKVGDMISLLIQDNGIGVSAEKKINSIKKESLSIPITKERLGLLSRILKKRFTFNIAPNKSGCGTTVYISIPDIALQ